MDFAALITKEEPELWFTAEIIVNGKVIKSAQYATRASAFKFITLHTIEETRQKEETTND
jgi:hypothetical protein